MKYAEEGYEYHVNMKRGDVGRYVITPGDPKRCEKIAAYLNDARLIADNREFVTYTGYLDGEKVSVTSSGIGGPSAAIMMEELANLGADTFIRVGTCGGMQPHMLGGDLAIASAAVRAEGTSKEYAPIEYPAVSDYEVLNALVKSANKLGFTSHVGVVQCKDSFYGQHSPEIKPVKNELLDKWEAWKMLGCLASEMESAALFIVASFRKVRCGTVLLVVANQEREKLGLENPVVHNTEDAILTAIEAVRELIREDKKKEMKE